MRRAAVGSLRLLRAAGGCERGALAAAGELAASASSTSLSAPVAAATAAAPVNSSSCTPALRFAHSVSVNPADVAASEEADARANHRHHTAPSPADTGGPLAKYNAGLQSGLYRPDPRQALTIKMLQELYDDLQRAGSSHALPGQPQHRPRRRPSGLTIVDTVGPASDDNSQQQPSASGRGASSTGGGGGGWFASLLGGGGGQLGRGAPSPAAPPAARGLYMYGGVGCGKTMLMDLFVNTAPPHFRVLRTHFHDFMLDVHASLRKAAREADPLVAVADGIAARCRVLALDELFVTDVADAMIVNRLFGRLWDRGLVLVATSNRQPDDLYKGGLQRNLFMPFIHRLKVQCVAHDMASSTDYRRLAQHAQGLYFVEDPATHRLLNAETEDERGGAAANADAALKERFEELAGPGAAAAAPSRVEVMMGRTLAVPLAAGKACMFSFAELCGRPVAAADYLALSAAFHTLALRGVPLFGASNRSEAYRFVTLVDVLYEARTRLLVTAAAPPLELFANVLTQQDAAKRPQLAARPDAVVDDNLAFAKDRTISRLTEMQSLEYLLHHARAHEPSLLLALQEAHAKVRGAASAAGH